MAVVGQLYFFTLLYILYAIGLYPIELWLSFVSLGPYKPPFKLQPNFSSRNLRRRRLLSHFARSDTIKPLDNAR